MCIERKSCAASVVPPGLRGIVRRLPRANARGYQPEFLRSQNVCVVFNVERGGKIPKGCRSVATGANPWNRVERWMRPGGTAEFHLSFKNIFLFKRNFMRAEEGQQFIAERFCPMMFNLPLNVTANDFNLGMAHGKNTVAFLPRKRSQMRKGLVNPARRIGLEISNKRRNGFVRPPTKQNVDMVGDAANFQRRAMFAANDAAKIVVNSRADVIGQPRFTMLGAEDKVELQVVKGSGHERSLIRRPVGAEEDCLNSIPRVSLRSTRGDQPKLLWSNLKPTVHFHV